MPAAATKLDVDLPGPSRPSQIVKRLAACLPEAVAEVSVATSHLHLVSNGHGKQAAFEVEVAGSIHKWMTYSGGGDEYIVRELSTGPPKTGGISIDLAVVTDGGKTAGGKNRPDRADALIELKVIHGDPKVFKNRSKNGKAGQPKPLDLKDDLKLLNRVKDPADKSWIRTQKTSIVAVAVCFTELDITPSALATVSSSPNMRLAGTQSFSVFSRSSPSGLQGVGVAYFVADAKNRRAPKSKATP